MSRSRVIRARAFALMLALLGGGYGLPLFDSLVFHSRPGVPVAERTLVDLGGRPTHAQVCPLQQPAVTDGCWVAGSVPLEPALPDSSPAVARIDSPTGRSDRTLPPSRAPPLRA